MMDLLHAKAERLPAKPALERNIPKVKKQLRDFPAAADCLALFGIEMISTLPYLLGLGFYSDDWQYMATLAQSSGQGVPAMFRQMVNIDDHFLIRPLQLLFFVLGFKSFGLHPLPYHILSSILLGLVVVFMYIALKELSIPRSLAFVIALVFGLLPHYSTDRFWISSHQATECMAFALFGIWALRRSLRPDEKHSLQWAALSAVSLIFSLLSYEVALGLMIVSLGIIAWLAYREIRASSNPKYTKLGILAGAACAFLVAAFIKAKAQNTIVYHHHFFKRLGELTWHAVTQALRFDFWTYCLDMPAVLMNLYRESALQLPALATAVLVAIFVTVYLHRRMEPFEIPGYHQILWLVLAGLVLFGLGYGLFFVNAGSDFSAPGLGDRVTIASAPGAACVLVALASLPCWLLKGTALRSRVFSVLIGLICAANSLVVSGIGSFWDNAAAQQAMVLKSVAAHVQSLPEGSVLLLDGLCRYSGPGVVFEAPWDATGAVQLTLNDHSLSSAIVSSSLAFHDTSAEFTIYGSAQDFPYGDHLFVYNVKQESVMRIRSPMEAKAYLSKMNPTGNNGCPAAQDGKGARIF